MVESIDRDPVRPETPIALAEQEIREAGGDPDATRARGDALAKMLLEKRRHLWREEARRDLEADRKRIAALPPVPRASLDVLRARLANVMRDPRWAGQLAAAFHKREPEEASAEEIATLLEQIQALRVVAGLPPIDEADDSAGEVAGDDGEGHGGS